MITNIVKRDGRRKKFSITKIQNAITAAFNSLPMRIIQCDQADDNLTCDSQYGIIKPRDANDIIVINAFLKLFDSNECYIETHRKRDWHTTDNETADCNYNVLDNEITFKYRVLGENYETDTCTIAKNGLECEHLLYLYAYNKDIWKKNS